MSPMFDGASSINTHTDPNAGNKFGFKHEIISLPMSGAGNKQKQT